MEAFPQRSRRQESDHDYVVNSRTAKSWEDEKNQVNNASITNLNCESVMANNENNDSTNEHDVIEEEIVENVLIGDYEASEGNSRLSMNNKNDIDLESKEKTGNKDNPTNSSNDKILNNSDANVDKDKNLPSSQTKLDDTLIAESDVNSQKKISESTDLTTDEKLDLNDEEIKCYKNVSDDKNCEITDEENLSNSVVETTLKAEKSQESHVAESKSGPQEKKSERPRLPLKDDLNESEIPVVVDTSSKVCDSSSMSVASGDDFNDFANEPNDEVDMSDVSSSFAESESISDVSGTTKSSPIKRPRRRQPPIMIGYKKRRKIQHSRKLEDDNEVMLKSFNPENGLDAMQTSEAEGSVDDERSEEGSHHTFEPSSSEENLFEGVNFSSSFKKNCSNPTNEPSDKYCWTCHKNTGVVFKCLACPRVFHIKCYMQITGIDPSDDLNNFQCPECVAVLRADNINTRSPTLATVNLDQLCVSLKHVINLLKDQKDSHYFWGPVDTKEFPHYTEYIVHPMNLTILEKNVSNKIYGCTEAFIADIKWIVHNSIVFNSKAAKITNVAKNLLKICKREIAEIETCAECYYNSLVRIDTWFIEVCKRPHILVWARLKGYPPWPAKALKCKDNMVDCRFFGAHDKAWVPLKDCFLYSKIPPQPTKMKKSNHLELGIRELEDHIKKLKDKFGIFTYPSARTPYQPANELNQIRLMLPNYDPKSSGRLATKYLIHPDRVKDMKPKVLFNDGENNSIKEESDDEKRLDEMDSDDQDKPLKVPPQDESIDTDLSVSSSENEASNLPDDHKVLKSDEQPEMILTKSLVQEKSASVSLKSSEKIDSKELKNSNIRICKPDDGKVEGLAKIRKVVVVKNIDAINAAVLNHSEKSLIESLTSVPIKDSSARKLNVQLSDCAPSVKLSTLSKPESAVFKARKSIGEKQKFTLQDNRTIATNKESEVFDLDKVKDEPVDVDLLKNDELISEKRTSKPVDTAQSHPTSTKNKRPGESENIGSIKKSKPDSNLRSVNITENVTLSVVNPASNVDASKSQGVSLKHLPHKKQHLSNTAITEGYIDNAFGVTKSRSTPPLKKVVNSTVPQTNSVNRSQVKILPRPRIQSVVCYTNGPSNNGAKSTPSTPSVPKIDPPSRLSTSSLDEFLYNEYQNYFKKFFEETIDKLAGKGDLKAKIVSLQKEIETLKRNQELFIDELKRDYETQIAELRATSIAMTQFNLAEERLKFEQEKEMAVKEAKSKQWCSNCQKSANYYCCWNTAYCDFECQKKHWIHHMQVCKNDVKKKTAESSENEPPRIMMQNDASNNYILNGYDKSGSAYSYHNSNSVVPIRNYRKIQPAKTLNTAKTISKPLSRISSTTNATPLLSSSSVSTTSLGNLNQSFPETTTYQTVSSSTASNLKAHSFARKSAHFHK